MSDITKHKLNDEYHECSMSNAAEYDNMDREISIPRFVANFVGLNPIYGEFFKAFL